MGIKIALAGNPNSGKTTLFNALTGMNQYVGNWPGVTVEKKEGNIKGYDDVIITDLPGIYSMSPYTQEEVVSRDYLVNERPQAILNIVDGTNLERNLYLTTQLIEIGIPVVIAINMLDLIKKSGDRIDIEKLSSNLGCRVVQISALKGEGISEAAEAAIAAAKGENKIPMHPFSGAVEHTIAHIEEAVLHNLPEEQQRWYAVKLLERDERVNDKLQIPAEKIAHIENDIVALEKEYDDESCAIIANERYNFIEGIINRSYERKNTSRMSTSDKIDKVVTSRIFGLPVFAFIMFLIYYISMVTVGKAATDWANEGLFGSKGFHLFTIGQAEYEEKISEYTSAQQIIDAFIDLEKEGYSELKDALDTENADFDAGKAAELLHSYADNINDEEKVSYTVQDEETLATETVEVEGLDYKNAVRVFEKYNCIEPDPAESGIWIPSIPKLIGDLLDRISCAEWLKGLILDGIVAGVGAVLGFLPQMFVLFLLLAFLEDCGYMSRIAFVLDRIFRKFGLSGKSFIPILIGTGCSVPGIMASRTIENINDRRMTVMTTSFMPCSAKVPFISMIAGAIFGGSALVASSAYFIGIAAIIISGIMLKKTKAFSGEATPFVMELPAYHWPRPSSLFKTMWDRGWSFFKKAVTIILLSTVLVWFTTYFGFADGTFRMLAENELDKSILALIGNTIAWIFTPLGFGNWKTAVASITGLVAKENIVGTMGILYGAGGLTAYEAFNSALTPLAGFSFMLFNLLCAPCFAAVGAIRREMNSAKWTVFAISYECTFAYAVSLMVYQIGSALNGNANIIGLAASAMIILFMGYMLFKPMKKKSQLG